MVQTELQIGKMYTLGYRSEWKDHDISDIRISAITTESNSATYGVDSVYSEFFAAYNIGLAAYTSYMSMSKEVYVCEVIKTRSPIEIDTSLVLIPKIIIDFNSTDELILCDKYTIHVKGILNNQPFVYKKGKYVQDITKKMKNLIRDIEEIGDSNVTTSVTSTDIIMNKSEYDEYEKYRVESFNVTNKAKTQINKKLLDEQNANLNKYKELQDAIATQKKNLESLAKTIEESVNTKDALVKTRDGILTLFNRLELPDGNSEKIVVGDAQYVNITSTITSALGKL